MSCIGFQSVGVIHRVAIKTHWKVDISNKHKCYSHIKKTLVERLKDTMVSMSRFNK